MTIPQLIQLAEARFRCPCRLQVYVADGKVTVDVHFGLEAAVTSTRETFEECVDALTTHLTPKRSTPQTSEQTIALLSASLNANKAFR